MEQEETVSNSDIKWMAKTIRSNTGMHDYIFPIIKKNNENYTSINDGIKFDIEQLSNQTLKELYQAIQYWIENRKIMKQRDEQQQQYETIINDIQPEKEEEKQKPSEEWVINVEDEDTANKMQSFLNELPQRTKKKRTGKANY